MAIPGNGSTIKRILTIAGSDSSGGAGIQADLKTISALSGYGMSAITAVTAQNTRGVQAIHEIPPALVGKQIDSVLSDIGADAVKTGMLGGPETVRIVAEKLRAWQSHPLVVDPVLTAKDGAALIREDARQVLLEELIPLATVVTPNIPEAEELTGLRISSVDEMKTAAESLHRLGSQYVVIKGGHASGDPIDLLFDGGVFYEFRARRLDTVDTHGTGCAFATAIAVGLAEGMPVYDAVERAKRFVFAAIEAAFRLGEGHGPVNPRPLHVGADKTYLGHDR